MLRKLYMNEPYYLNNICKIDRYFVKTIDTDTPYNFCSIMVVQKVLSPIYSAVICPEYFSAACLML